MPTTRRRRKKPGTTSDSVLMKSAEVIGWALGGLEREIEQTRQRLSSLTDKAGRLRRQLGARGAAAPEGNGSAPRPKRTMSAQARKRISVMMKKRWAERKRRQAAEARK